MNWYKREKIAGLPIYSERIVIKKLKRMGCKMIRQIRSSHQIWECPGRGKISLPIHSGGGQDVDPRLLDRLLRQELGVNRNYFARV